MKTLLLVDIQNDFLPTGALPVPEGDQIVPLVNQLQKKFDLHTFLNLSEYSTNSYWCHLQI